MDQIRQLWFDTQPITWTLGLPQYVPCQAALVSIPVNGLTVTGSLGIMISSGLMERRDVWSEGVNFQHELTWNPTPPMCRNDDGAPALRLLVREE